MMTESEDFSGSGGENGTEAGIRPATTVHGNKNTILGKDAVYANGDVGGDIVTGAKEVTNIFQNGGVWIVAIVAIVAIMVILGMAWLRLPPSNEPPLPTKNELATASPPAPTVSPTATATPTQSPVTAPPPPPACYVDGADDQSILRRLIALESEASGRKDLSIIRGIFAPNALVADGAGKAFWLDPLARYQAYFKDVQAITVTRTAVQPVARGVLEDVAWFTSGDETRIIHRDGIEAIYENPAGSNHWTFARNAQGCWQITGLVFNAAHINFPCYCNLANDAENLRCLIDAESRAVREENPLLIWAIFAPDAGIQDGEILLASNPLDFYLQQRFAKYDYIDPLHLDISKILIEAERAIYTSGSQGTIRNGDGTESRYENPAPADRWEFQRNLAGCWVIGKFAFNQK